MTKTALIHQQPDEMLLFVEAPGSITELVKTFYGYKVCKASRCHHFGGENAAIKAADCFLAYATSTHSS
jgi:hypothetical protein